MRTVSLLPEPICLHLHRTVYRLPVPLCLFYNDCLLASYLSVSVFIRPSLCPLWLWGSLSSNLFFLHLHVSVFIGPSLSFLSYCPCFMRTVCFEPLLPAPVCLFYKNRLSASCPFMFVLWGLSASNLCFLHMYVSVFIGPSLGFLRVPVSLHV